MTRTGSKSQSTPVGHSWTDLKIYERRTELEAYEKARVQVFLLAGEALAAELTRLVEINLVEICTTTAGRQPGTWRLTKSGLELMRSPENGAGGHDARRNHDLPQRPAFEISPALDRYRGVTTTRAARTTYASRWLILRPKLTAAAMDILAIFAIITPAHVSNLWRAAFSAASPRQGPCRTDRGALCRRPCPPGPVRPGSAAAYDIQRAVADEIAGHRRGPDPRGPGRDRPGGAQRAGARRVHPVRARRGGRGAAPPGEPAQAGGGDEREPAGDPHQ